MEYDKINLPQLGDKIEYIRYLIGTEEKKIRELIIKDVPVETIMQKVDDIAKLKIILDEARQIYTIASTRQLKS